MHKFISLIRNLYPKYTKQLLQLTNKKTNHPTVKWAKDVFLAYFIYLTLMIFFLQVLEIVLWRL